MTSAQAFFDHFSRSKATRCLASVVTILVLMNVGCKKKYSERDIRQRSRPAEIQQDVIDKKISSWSLEIDGVPFKDHPILELNKKFKLTGKAEIDRERLYEFAYPNLLVAFRPIGENENEDWMAIGAGKYHAEFKALIKPGNVIDELGDLNWSYLKPGEYHTRLYLKIIDVKGGGERTTTDLLATSKITIKAGKTTLGDE